MINNVSDGGYASMMMQGMQRPMPPSSAQMADDLLSTADTDNNGTISKTEFTELFSSNVSSDIKSDESSSGANISGLFSEMDANGDDAISLNEATDAVSNLLQQLQEQRQASNTPPPPPPPSAEGIDALFGSADTDEDDSLSIDEFSSALKRSGDDDALLASMFEEADADGNGAVSQDELTAAMNRHQGEPAQSAVNIAANAANTQDKVSMLVTSLLQQYQQTSTNTGSNNIASNMSVSITA